MRTTTTTIAAITILITAAQAQAQDRWSFELRTNGAIPSQDIGSTDLGYAGFGFEATLGFRVAPHVAVYGGWDWMHFSPDETFSGIDTDFEETGYVFGLRFQHPLSGESGAGPAAWLRAGGTFNHIEIEDGDGAIIQDSGHGLGWEAAAGLSLGLGRSWRVTPGIRYRSLTRPLDIDAVSKDVDLRYLAFEVGFARGF